MRLGFFFRAFAATTACLALFVLAPTAASAATASGSGFTAAPGETNRVGAYVSWFNEDRWNAHGHYVSYGDGTGAQAQHLPPCSGFGFCGYATSPGEITLRGDDKDDQIWGEACSQTANCDSADWSFRIEGGEGGDQLASAMNRAYLDGGPGDDQFESGYERFPRVFDGGSGVDRIEYFSGGGVPAGYRAWGALNISLDGVANDGNQGSGIDNVLPNVESILGGGEGDILTGGVNADDLDGRGGNDTIDGKGGPDNLHGADGDDRLIGDADDGAVDRIFCGAGNDTVMADSNDVVASDCENVTGGQAGGAADRDGDGVPDARDNCPAVANPGQADSDPSTPEGDACERLRCTGGFYQSKADQQVFSWFGLRRPYDTVLTYGVDLFWCWNPATQAVELRQHRPVADDDPGGDPTYLSLRNLNRTLRQVLVFSYKWVDEPERTRVESRGGGRKFVTVASGRFDLCNEISLPVGTLAKLFKFKIPGRLGNIARKRISDLTTSDRRWLKTAFGPKLYGQIAKRFSSLRKLEKNRLVRRWSKRISEKELDELIAEGIVNKGARKAILKRGHIRGRNAKKYAKRKAAKALKRDEQALRDTIADQFNDWVLGKSNLLCTEVWRPKVTAQIARNGIEFITEDGTVRSPFGNPLLIIRDPR
jgi:hypothetical protein